MISVSQKLGDSLISVVENKEYNRVDIKKYIQMFCEYKENDTIRAEGFYDNKWVIISGIDKNIINFNIKEFELQFKIAQKSKVFSDVFSLEDLEISIKSFILYQLRIYTSSTIAVFYRRISKMLNNGIISNVEIPDKYIENDYIFNSSGYILLRKYLDYIFQFYRNNVFLDNLEEKYYEYLYQRWERRRTEEDKRALPSMETMFKFNDIINTFIVSSINEKDEKKKRVLMSLKEKYFPIILWWKVTSIIPMRNAEFCVTPKDCIFKKDGIPYLKFRRSALKGKSTKPINFDHSVETSYYIEKFPISNELYNLIDEYKNLVKKYDEVEDFYGNGIKGAINRKFLLSYRNYKMFCRNSNITDDDEIITADLLYSIINNFLVEYVAKELGLRIIPKSKEYDQQVISEYELNDISIMDTRHYAIMNLHFMGYESATIQRIIGHETFDQQLSYFAHAEAFINCYIVSIAKEIAEKKSKQYKKDLLDMTFTDMFGKKGSGNERFEIVKNRELEENYLKTKQLDDGLCSYELIESDTTPCRLYQGEHGMCPYFVGNSKRSLTLVNDAFQKMTDDISTELKVLADVTRNKKQYTGALIEQANVSKNKIMSWAQTKAQMIADFIINGVQMKG